MKLEPIRIRLVAGQQIPTESSPREAFWRAILQPQHQDDDISVLEGRLRREFGSSLRRLLINEVSEPIRQVESTLYRGEFRDFERILFRFFDGPRSEKDWDRGQALDAFARLTEQRQQMFRDNAPLRRLQERVAAAASVTFAARIAGYSSLNLDLSLGSITKVADAFENDFDSFRIFLEAFIPKAFDDIFLNINAHIIDFSVQIPSAYEKEFQSAAAAISPIGNAVQPLLSLQSSAQASSSRERAEWLWRLANGSLLIPLLLSLFVTYQGVAMLKGISNSQTEALKPILDHQLKLLEEDRHRLFKEPPTPVVPVAPAGSPTKP